MKEINPIQHHLRYQSIMCGGNFQQSYEGKAVLRPLRNTK